MRTYVDISDRVLLSKQEPGRALIDLGPFAHSVESPKRLEHANAWRVFFQVPDSPEGLLL